VLAPSVAMNGSLLGRLRGAGVVFAAATTPANAVSSALETPASHRDHD
jgi:hypothetical protein